MSAANEMRRRFAQVMLAIGALLLLFGVFAKSGWGHFALFMGGGLFTVGGIMFASVSVIDGVPWLVRLLSRLSDPKWDGEMLHTDGDEYKIRYDFGEDGNPRFVASDICAAVGTSAPAKDALEWRGVALSREGKHAYFGEADVQTYLELRAVRNHAAKRLLVLIRTDVLFKLEKRRDDARRFDQGQR
ncbi:MAG: hypothetical protein D4R74_09325 [Betaproteobacteria bacterium]|nr:MAG: hypothetical protein D4R74_09325 [Betaproteobacteria bacterium]